MNNASTARWTAGILLLGLTLNAGLPVSEAGTQELRVSAAMSLAPALQEAIASFQVDNPGVNVVVNAAASGKLRMQIEAGAPADVFVSASAREMDLLENRGLVVPGSRTNVLKNELVLIVPIDAPEKIRELQDLTGSGVRRIALGSPRSAPVGMYAEEALRHLGLWNSLTDKFVFAEHVRQILDYVARGEVDAGFVYRTDAALQSGTVDIVTPMPPASHRAIAYPAAVITGSADPAAARRFVRFLGSAPAREIFRNHGFVVDPLP